MFGKTTEQKLRDRVSELEAELKEMELEATKAKEVAKVKDNYQDKVEKHLEKRNDELREMYNEVLSIVPKVEALVECT